MKIRMLTSVAGPDIAPASRGQVIEVDEARAKAWIGAGAAEEVKEPTAPGKAEPPAAGEGKKKYTALKNFQFAGEKRAQGDVLELTAEEAEKLVEAEKVAPAEG